MIDVDIPLIKIHNSLKKVIKINNSLIKVHNSLIEVDNLEVKKYQNKPVPSPKKVTNLQNILVLSSITPTLKNISEKLFLKC